MRWKMGEARWAGEGRAGCEGMMWTVSRGLRVVAFVVAAVLSWGPTMAAERRLPVPERVLFMYGYADAVTGKPVHWGSRERYKAAWADVLRTFTVVDGITRDAALVRSMRTEGRIFAYHVMNTIDEKHRTAEDLVAEWSVPFENTLEGRLPGGFDAISIDEFHSYPDGNPLGELSLKALRMIRQKYPERLIFASGVYKLADGGPMSLYGPKSITYNQTLDAIYKYADILVLENYVRTGHAQLESFPGAIKNVHAVNPHLIEKTIFALNIAQVLEEARPADDDPWVPFGDFLETQVKLIKGDPVGRRMPGIGFWIFYRSTPQTIMDITRLVRRYY